MELLDEVIGLAEEFEKRNIEYALCGGLAVLVHGIVRNTIDIDFLILESALEDAKSAAAAAGFDFDSGWIPIRGADAPKVFRLLKIEESDYIVLDLMLVSESLQEIWADRIRCPFGRRPITVVSRAGLIRMKSQSIRHKDQMDVESLNALGGENP